MPTDLLEERLSAVEAELAELKRQLNGNGFHAPFAAPDKTIPSSSKKAGALDAALSAIWRDTPDDAWDKLPADFGDNLDHYLYGTPKR